jgi:prepilin-type N-terminal cleavage/methylation domain-containing protein
MQKFFTKNKKGFTLVEMMVSIAVFSVVMVAAMSALLNVIDANNKAKSIKVAVNNISFALEGISKDMRMGTNYACGTNSGDEPSGECPIQPGGAGGGKIISYISPRATNNEHRVYYKFENGKIWECLEKNNINCTFNGPFVPITSAEVTITDAKFYITGAESPVDVLGTQPRMIMTVSGYAGSRTKERTNFDLQTSVSQRIRPRL